MPSTTPPHRSSRTSSASRGGRYPRPPQLKAALPPPLELRTSKPAPVEQVAEAAPPLQPAPVEPPLPRAEDAATLIQQRPHMPLGGESGAPPTMTGNPRFQALLCYALPFVPALALLFRERRNAFVRLHAARALAFFGAIAVAQVLLFVALIFIGGFAGDGAAAVAFGLLFYGLFGLLGVGAVAVWLRLLADASAGRLTYVPLLTATAWRIEWVFARLQHLPS